MSEKETIRIVFPESQREEALGANRPRLQRLPFATSSLPWIAAILRMVGFLPVIKLLRYCLNLLNWFHEKT